MTEAPEEEEMGAAEIQAVLRSIEKTNREFYDHYKAFGPSADRPISAQSIVIVLGFIFTILGGGWALFLKSTEMVERISNINGRVETAIHDIEIIRQDVRNMDAHGTTHSTIQAARIEERLAGLETLLRSSLPPRKP